MISLSVGGRNVTDGVFVKLASIVGFWDRRVGLMSLVMSWKAL